MSYDAIGEFFKRAEEDSVLQEGLRAVAEGGADDACGALTALAVEHGFQFTVEELHDALEGARRSEGDGELSDDDLEAVAGGVMRSQLHLPMYLPGVPNSRTLVMKYGLSPGGRMGRFGGSFG
jgi:predicted ribosomally synthesized peptide with nif11-like leader